MRGAGVEKDGGFDPRRLGVFERRLFVFFFFSKRGFDLFPTVRGSISVLSNPKEPLGISISEISPILGTLTGASEIASTSASSKRLKLGSRTVVSDVCGAQIRRGPNHRPIAVRHFRRETVGNWPLRKRAPKVCFSVLFSLRDTHICGRKKRFERKDESAEKFPSFVSSFVVLQKKGNSKC